MQNVQHSGKAEWAADYALKNSWWKLGPMIKAGYSGLTSSMKQAGEKNIDDSFSALNCMAGLDCRCTLGRYVSAGYAEINLYAKLYAEYTSFIASPLPNGISINFTVGIDLMAHKLK